MAHPDTEATRVFTFAESKGGRVRLVEALHRVPQGLYRLQASECSRAQYRVWTAQITRRARTGHLPERVRLGAAMTRRKRWEVGTALAEGRIGAEVDSNLLHWFAVSDEPPPHPALSLDTGAGPSLSVAELAAATPHSLRPFIQRAAHAALKRQWEELGGSALIDSGSSLDRVTNMRSAAADWGAQWGMAALSELLQDLAVFYFAIGDRGASRTFKAAGVGEAQAIELLQGYVAWLVSTGFAPDSMASR